jgi:hypothetical protein
MARDRLDELRDAMQRLDDAMREAESMRSYLDRARRRPQFWPDRRRPKHWSDDDRTPPTDESD